MKTCSKCGRTKTLSSFHRDSAVPDGHKARCKDCRCAETRQWTRNNPEKSRAAERRWAAANRSRSNEIKRRWAKRNPDLMTRAISDWIRRHPERQRDYRYRRLAERTNTPETTARIAVILTEPCAYCGTTDNITVDHIVPLSRGGTHTPDNLAPACRRCNSTKGTRSPEEWLGPDELAA